MIGHVEVLPGVAFVVALVTVALLVFRSPFPRALVLVIVTGHSFLFEFSVMARNYGISALLLFVIAAWYRSSRDRGVILGLLLFLLANTNVLAAIMVGDFLLFWLLDVFEETGLRWTPQLTNFVLNAVIATIGVAVCGLTILPTINDAAARDWSTSSLRDGRAQGDRQSGRYVAGRVVPRVPVECGGLDPPVRQHLGAAAAASGVRRGARRALGFRPVPWRSQRTGTTGTL